jgi:hypothetical protein
MSFIPSDVKKEWKNISQKLNSSSEGLGVRCKLIFSVGFETSSSVAQDPIGKKPPVMLSYGGRSSARKATGHTDTDDTSGGDGLKEKITEKIIDGRVHSIRQAFERFQLGAQETQNVYSLITKKEIMPDLVRCKEAIFNIDLSEKRVRVRLLRPPSTHGLGQAVQCKSYWEEI